MNDFGHSRLLKFFVNPKMADTINETNGIASAVPGEQKIREADEQTENNAVATKDDFTLSPVITVTKKEASFSKGDLKLQKVTVTEDISDEAAIGEEVNVESVDTMIQPEDTNIVNSETGEEVKKVSKIPRLRFRAAVNKIRREQRNDESLKRKEAVASPNRRKSSIPRLKGNKSPPPKEEIESKRESINFDDLISNVTEADFDKIYEEVVEKPNVLGEGEVKLENKDAKIVETKFDEIIHAYDANKIEPIKIDKSKSKIPLLKRKSEHDIEVKVVTKESQRKGSLGRIPISNSFANWSTITSPDKVKLSQTNNSANFSSKQDRKASISTTHSDLEIDDNNNGTHPIVTVTTIPLSKNKYTNISSVVLNKQPIRIHSAENNKINQTNEQTHSNDGNEDKTNKTEDQTCNDVNEDKSDDAMFILPKLEMKSVVAAVISEKSPLSSELQDTNELKDAIETKNNLNEEHDFMSASHNICEADIKVEGNHSIDNNTSNKIHLSSEKAFYCNSETKLDEKTNIIPTQLKNTYSNNDLDSISNETPKLDLHSLEPEIENEIKSENSNNDVKTMDNDYLSKETIPPKINESEAFIKYKPNVREVEVSNENFYSNNYDTNKNANTDYKNKSLNSNESLKSRPVKYKTITASQTVEEINEEDIIILKGKVNRVISRLDSIEPKQEKKPLNDLPKQSVKTKIFLFECNDPRPTVTKTAPSKSNSIHSIDDKPRVVEGVLKESNKIKDFKELEGTKLSVNLESKLVHDEVKIAYGLTDELRRWKNDNTNNFPCNKTLHAENGSEKNGVNEIATDIHSRHDIKKIDKRETLATEDDIFAKKSADIISSYKLSQQKKNINVESDMKRAKSLAELDMGDGVTGKVKKVVYRMKSVDKIEHRKEIINSRERPRKGSVSERIALFEGRVPKAAPLKMSLHEAISSAPVQDPSERLAELTAAAAKYGTFQNISHVEVGGVEVPALWVGTAMLESGVTRQLIKTAIELGYRAFDTAYIYGTEREVGEAIREKIADGTVKREDLFVAGKLWSTFHRTDLVELVCRESLEKLGLDYFDLYMIHNPMSFKEGGDPIPTIANVVQYSEHDYLDAWFGIEGVMKKGLARAAGVSNFNTKQIQRILDKGKIRPVVNQVESHPYLTQLGLESFCSGHNIRLSVFGTLGSKGTPAPFKSNLPPAIDDPLVIAMAAGLDITPAQLLIRYQLTLGRAVVVKCSSGARLWENQQAQAAPLRPEHVRALHNLNRNQRTFTFRGMGDTHKNYPFTELV